METTIEFEIDKHICHLISLLGQLDNSKQSNDSKNIDTQPMKFQQGINILLHVKATEPYGLVGEVTCLSNIATKLKEAAFLKLDKNIHDFEQCIKMVVILKMMAAAAESHDEESFKNYQNELKNIL